MKIKSKQICCHGEQGVEQKMIIEGHKVTLRYSGQRSPQRIEEMKALLLSAQVFSRKN